jgi:hypothetical protein
MSQVPLSDPSVQAPYEGANLPVNQRKVNINAYQGTVQAEKITANKQLAVGGPIISSNSGQPLVIMSDVVIQGSITSTGPNNVNTLQPIFPGDQAPVMPDVVVVGGGCCGLTVTKILSDNPNLRVLCVDAGRDTTKDPIVTQPFAAQPYRGTGPVTLNAIGVLLDPSVSSFQSAVQGPQDAWTPLSTLDF